MNIGKHIIIVYSETKKKKFGIKEKHFVLVVVVVVVDNAVVVVVLFCWGVWGGLHNPHIPIFEQLPYPRGRWWVFFFLYDDQNYAKTVI